MTRSIALFCLLSVITGCEAEPATTPDAGADVDAGGPLDAGAPDAGAADAGELDAASDDAGAGDAGAPDAGTPDAGAGAGDTCAEALDVTGGGTFSGTTVGATDDYAPMGAGCPTGGAASGEDVAYLLQPSVATSYQITVTPLDAIFDPMLYAVTSCGGVGCEAGTVLNGPGQTEQITVNVAAGATVYVIVDGELFTNGAFDLDVTIL